MMEVSPPELAMHHKLIECGAKTRFHVEAPRDTVLQEMSVMIFRGCYIRSRLRTANLFLNFNNHINCGGMEMMFLSQSQAFIRG